MIVQPLINNKLLNVVFLVKIIMGPLWALFYVHLRSFTHDFLKEGKMPKITPLIPTEVLLKELDSLAGSILIIPEQVAKLTATSKRQLKDDRENGAPPPYVKKGGSYMYRIEDVRNYLKSLPVYQSTSEEYRAKLKENGSSYLGVHLSFGDFLNHGTLNDSWSFTIIKGKPIDFIASLALEIEDEEGVECKDLTMEEYLNLRLKSAYIEHAEWERRELEGGATGKFPEHTTPQIGKTN